MVQEGLHAALGRNSVSKVTPVLKQAVNTPGDTIPPRTGAAKRKEGVNDNQQCHTIPRAGFPGLLSSTHTS